MNTKAQADFVKQVKHALLFHPNFTTVKELARATGYHRNTVSRAIHRGCFPRVLKRICRELSLGNPLR